MGYSARYHAASLAAVFVALAVGVLIGVGLGNSPRRGLERSLRGDVKNARADADRLTAELGRERDFAGRVYPALVGDRLSGRQVGVIALGGLPEDAANDIEDALQPTGAKLAEVTVVRLPPDLNGLAKSLPRSFRRLQKRSGGRAFERYARQVGRQLVVGGPLLDRTRDRLLSRASGKLAGVDDVILVRSEPDGLGHSAAGAAEKWETNIVQGVQSAGRPTVAVERSDSKTSSVSFFKGQQVSTVDDVDLVAGRVALVFSLLGAEGNFGVKDGADRLLPELLVPQSRPGA
jgi:hypothetical protein